MVTARLAGIHAANEPTAPKTTTATAWLNGSHDCTPNSNPDNEVVGDCHPLADIVSRTYYWTQRRRRGPVLPRA